MSDGGERMGLANPRGADEAEITHPILKDVIQSTDKSVTHDMLTRFDKWSAEAQG